jgi:hypothetical protein
MEKAGSLPASSASWRRKQGGAFWLQNIYYFIMPVNYPVFSPAALSAKTFYVVSSMSNQIEHENYL